LQDNILKKTEEHIDRAFIYYGAGAEKAGGQVKEVPYVVYIDSNNKPLTDAKYNRPIFQAYDPNKFGVISNNLPENMGNEPNLSVPVELLPSAFGFILPFKPVEQFKLGLSWNRIIYASLGIAANINDLPIFPISIEQKVRGYEIKKERNCAVLDYAISGVIQRTENDARGKFTLQGKGVAYYDPAEEIIVEKEQTISMSRLTETIALLDNGQAGWKATVDNIETVNIKISLQSEKGQI
jgi:hypothetical protein